MAILQKSQTAKITIRQIKARKNGSAITALTAYDYPFAKILDDAGIDIILIGDSLGPVALGYDNTLPVTVEEMEHHVRAVRRAVKHALLVADMPRLGISQGRQTADNRRQGKTRKAKGDYTLQNAKALIAAGAEAIKIEGTEHLEMIKQFVEVGIPVMGHLGYTPQNTKKFPQPRLFGKDPAEAAQLLNDALLLEKAGVFSIVLECVPAAVAQNITALTKVPTIGCGAGSFTDGQILVLYDILGLTQGKTPCFAKQYVNLSKLTSDAVKQYIRNVSMPAG